MFDNLMAMAKKLAPFGTLRREDVCELAGSGRSHTVDSNLVGQFINGPRPNMLPDAQVPVDILSKTGEADSLPCRRQLFTAIARCERDRAISGDHPS